MSAERLGICTRYQQHEATYAALHIAAKALDMGIDVTLLGRGTCHKDVFPFWDNRLIKEKNLNHFASTIADCSRVLWTHVPTEDEVIWAKVRGIDTWLLVSWDELRPEHEGICALINKLICPFKCVTKALMQHWGGNVVPVDLAWDVPIPLTRKSDRGNENIRCLLPLYDTQARRSDQVIFDIVKRMLEQHPHVEFNIATGSGWAGSSRKFVKWLQKAHANRVNVTARPQPLHRLLAFAHNDLTVWPSKFEGIATIGLGSLCMGTPVLAWDIDPSAEYLKDEINSRLVPCNLRENWLGVPEAVPDWNVFEDHLSLLLTEPDHIERIRQSTSHRLKERRAAFEKGWKTLWS